MNDLFLSRRLWPVIAAAFAVTLALAGGCASDTQGLSSAQSDLAAGRYEQAYNTSSMIVANPAQPERTRERAAYIAGLSAYRAKSYDKAHEYLQYAAATPDNKLRGDAKATLGLVYSERENFPLAAKNLLEAAELMSGPDKANAYFYAGVAQQKQGLWATARTTLSLALSAGEDSAFRDRVKDQLRVTGYALQTGAFSSEDNARKMAESLYDKARKNSMIAPRVVSAMDQNGKGKLYLVQLGAFSSWPTALMARETLKPTTAIVVPIVSAGTPVDMPASSDASPASPAAPAKAAAAPAKPAAKPAAAPAPAPSSGAAVAKPVAPKKSK